MMSLATFLVSFLLLLATERLHADTHSTMILDGCTGTPNSLLTAINASVSYNLTRVIPNCLEYSDNRSIISFGSLSFEHVDGTRGRYIVECSNGLLLLKMSSQTFRENVSACYECTDKQDPCVTGTECSPNCELCLQSQCLFCTEARYNDMCISVCPNGGTPNPNNGNECECPRNFGGNNCQDCLLSMNNCESTYLFEDCSCKPCPSGNVQVLLNPEAQVPQSVIGTPGASHHERATTEEDSHSSSETEYTFCSCSNVCPNGWEKDGNNICYACGVTYCLNCTISRHCTRCRSGTLLNESTLHCDGFYSVIQHLAEELEDEEREEKAKLDKEKLELTIALPIICLIVVIVFVLFGVIGHFRYPHIGHDKRHRNPKKKVTENTIENKFRPQSTVRFR